MKAKRTKKTMTLEKSPTTKKRTAPRKKPAPAKPARKAKPSAAGKSDRLTKAESTGKPVRTSKPGRDPKRRNPMAAGAKAQSLPSKTAPANRRGRRVSKGGGGALEKSGVSKKKMGRHTGALAGGSQIEGSRAHGTGLNAQSKAKGARSPHGVNAKRARERRGLAHANEKPLEGNITPITVSEFDAATITSPTEGLDELPPPAAEGDGKSERAQARKR
jgi:hypothetical protein